MLKLYHTLWQEKLFSWAWQWKWHWERSGWWWLWRGENNTGSSSCNGYLNNRDIFVSNNWSEHIQKQYTNNFQLCDLPCVLNAYIISVSDAFNWKTHEYWNAQEPTKSEREANGGARSPKRNQRGIQQVIFSHTEYLYSDKCNSEGVTSVACCQHGIFNAQLHDHGQQCQHKA